MKKLMIAAAIVCAAAFVQAANVQWSLSNLSTSGAGDEYDVGYCFLSDAAGDSTYTAYTLATVEAWAKAGDFASIQAAAHMTIEPDGGVGDTEYIGSEVWGKGGEASPSYVKGFAVLFNVDYFDDIEDATMYTMVALDDQGNEAYAEFQTTGSSAAIALDASTSTWNAIGVPEPTSGLLLLLGVAGLALKRRRA